MFSTSLKDTLEGVFGRYWLLIALVLPLIPYPLSALSELKPPRLGQVTEDEYSNEAYHALAERNPAPPATLLYAVYGHTHNQDAQLIPAREGVPTVLYLNTGTWTPLFIEDRPDLMGRAFRPFVRFDRGSGGEYAHAYLQWNDERGGPDPIEILGPVRRSGWEGPAVVPDPEPAEPAEPGNAQPAVGP
jgi:hypothetical protein